MDDTIYIYALINSLDNNVFYIGATMYPNGRLCQHKCNTQGNPKKRKKISDILNSGGVIEMLILDECKKIKVTFLEDFYSDLFSSFGFELLQPRKSNYDRRIDIIFPKVCYKENEKSITYYMKGEFMGDKCVADAYFIKGKDINKWDTIDRLHTLYADRLSDVLTKNNIPFYRSVNWFYYS